MKIIRSVILLLLFAANALALSAQTSKEKKEQEKQELKEMIDSQDYKIDVRMAHPVGGRAVSLTSSYSLAIRNDSVFSNLPYYGRAYSIPYGGGDGLNFKVPLQDYSLDMDKKGTAKIKLVARNSEDRFTFNIRIFNDGSASINVNMQNRQSISYRGDVERKKD